MRGESRNMENQSNPSQRPAILAGLKPGEKFLFSVVVLFILLLASQFLGALLAAWIYGYSMSDILTLGAFDDPRYVAASKLIQLLGSVGTFIIPALLFSFLFSGNPFSYYRFRDPAGALAILITVGMMVSVIPLINYLAEINLTMEFPIESVHRIMEQLEGEAEKIMRAFTSTHSIWGLMVNLLMIGVVAAVGEELIFRGLLQKLLISMVKNAHIAILITAILFSAFHFQFFSFIPRFVLGVILGYLMLLGRSIWFPIIAHFVNNAMGVIYYYFNSRGSADDMLEEIGTSNLMPMAALISLLLFSVFFIAWYYQTNVVATRSPRPGKTGTD
ncbi:MAG: CPBP family intramembrane glutamic endopeptidase [Bacteroidota bacterium]